MVRLERAKKVRKLNNLVEKCTCSVLYIVVNL